MKKLKKLYAQYKELLPILLFQFWVWLHQKARAKLNKVFEKHPELKKEIQRAHQQVQTDNLVNSYNFIQQRMKSGRKTKGRKDASLKSRGNARKSQTKHSGSLIIAHTKKAA